MVHRNLFIVGLILTTLLLGCGTGSSDTFVRFKVEGQSYEVNGSSLIVTYLVDNVYSLELTDSSRRLVPSALIQWRMKLESVDQLAGQNLDLKSVDPNRINPVAIFRITEDLSVRGKPYSKFHLKIERIEEGFVEGSFSGKDLWYASRTKEVAHKVDVTARFRARLIQKQTVK